LEEVEMSMRSSTLPQGRFRLDPNYPDAQYNLAYVCENWAHLPKRGSIGTYLKLDPLVLWSNYAPAEAFSSIRAKSAGNI